MVFSRTLKLQRLADKLAAMTELQDLERPHEEPRPLIVNRRDPAWEKLKENIIQFVPELHYIGSADLIRSVYVAGIKDVEVLKSLAALSLAQSKEGQQHYDHQILTLAKCLSQCSPIPIKRSAKLCLIRTLITLRSPLEVGWQLQEVVIEDTLRFITERDYVWEYVDHYDEILLWELRAITLKEIENRVNLVAGYISKQALRIERGLELSTVVVNAGIEGAGAKLKECLEPDDKSLLDESQTILAYSEKAKQATDSVRLTSREALVRIHSTSAQGIDSIANKIHDGAPNESSRKALCAVGKVGAASVGAAALVADSWLESSSEVAKKTAAVTADVVEYKYGSKAGRLIRNASDTAGNIARTLGHVALLHKSRAMTKSLARATGKARVLQINEKCLLDECGGEYFSDDGEMFVAADDDMFHEEILEVQPQESILKSHDSEEQDPSDATSKGEQLLPSYIPHYDILLLEDNNNKSLSAEFAFERALMMSPSELDSCLPDQITGVGVQSDFFSDVTNELFYERTCSISNLLNRDSMAKNEIFRNLNNSRYESMSSIAGGVTSAKSDQKEMKQSSDSESLDCTACTMAETYVSNSTIEDHKSTSSPCDHRHKMSVDLDDDHSSHASGLEKHCEAWATGSEVDTGVPELNDKLCQSNRVPPNGYVLSDTGFRREAWPKELYSSVKSKLGM